MANAYTYSTLKTALQDWMEDPFEDFEDQLDDIIAKAEARCLRDLDLEIFDETDTSKSTAVGNQALALADDALVLRSLWINDVLVLPRTESYVRYFQGDASNGQPLYWCQHSPTEIALAPIPNAIYATRQRVLKRPAGLSDSVTETFLSTNVGDLLFWACAALSERFDKAPEDTAAAEQEYQAILARARHELRSLMRQDYA